MVRLFLLALSGCVSVSSLAAERDLHGLCVHTADTFHLEPDDSLLIAQTLHDTSGVEVSARLLSPEEVEAHIGVPLDGELIEIRTRVAEGAAFGAVFSRPMMAMDGGSVEQFDASRYGLLQILSEATQAEPEAVPQPMTRAPYAPTPRPEVQYRAGRRPNGLEQGANAMVRIFSLGVLNPRPPPATLTPTSRRAVSRWRAVNEPLRVAWEAEQTALVAAHDTERTAVLARNAETQRQATELEARRQQAALTLAQRQCDIISAGTECAEILVVPTRQANAVGRLSVSISGQLHGSPQCSATFSLQSSRDTPLRQSIGTDFRPSYAQPGELN